MSTELQFISMELWAATPEAVQFAPCCGLVSTRLFFGARPTGCGCGLPGSGHGPRLAFSIVGGAHSSVTSRKEESPRLFRGSSV